MIMMVVIMTTLLMTVIIVKRIIVIKTRKNPVIKFRANVLKTNCSVQETMIDTMKIVDTITMRGI